MDKYIKLESVLKILNEAIRDWDNNCGISRTEYLRIRFRNLPAADVVSWEWLKQYANGKRVNFTSDFVEEAEKSYKEQHHE